MAMIKVMEGYPDPDSADPMVVIIKNRLKLTSKKGIIILAASLISLTILISLSYYIYHNYFLRFTTLSSLNYDSQKAAGLLKDKDSIAFTRGDQLLIGNLKGEELVLIPSLLKFGQQSAVLKISYSRNYITWQSSQGIIGLNIPSQKVFLIFTGEPRQSYDLSPVSDKILFLSKTKLLEANLGNSYISHNLLLPKLANPKMVFNHTQYAPNGNLAYVRSIYNSDSKGKKEAVIEFQNNKITFMPDKFAEPIGLAPMWSHDSNRLLAYRSNGLTVYNLKNNTLEILVNNKDVLAAYGPYNFSQSDKYAVFIVAKEKMNLGSFLTNPEIILIDLDKTIQKTILKSDSPQLKSTYKNLSSAISDVGWLNEQTIWFTVNNRYANKDLWIINKDGANLKKVLENIDLYNYSSARMPLYKLII